MVVFTYGKSDQDDAEVVGNQVLDAPIEEVVVELAVADTELELLQEKLVIHEVEGVEDVEVGGFGSDEHLLDALLQSLLVADVEGLVGLTHVVERVGNAQSVVIRVV